MTAVVGLRFDEIAVAHHERALVRAALASEVALGRVERDGDRYRLRPEAFAPGLLRALRALGYPIDDAGRPAEGGASR
jgi:hypothetical protein